MRKLYLTAVALLMTAALGGEASAADFYLVSGNQNQIAVIDQDAITIETTGLVRAPLVAIRRASDTAGIGFAYAVVDSKFDCRQHEVTAISIALFARDGQAYPQQPTHGGKSDWVFAKPNTQSGASLEFVCDMSKDRSSKGFRLRGLTLAQIVGSVFNGMWPYDKVLTKQPAGKP